MYTHVSQLGGNTYERNAGMIVLKKWKSGSHNMDFWWTYLTANLSLCSYCARCYVSRCCARVICYCLSVLCSVLSTLCVGLSQCHVQSLVCVLCSLQSVLCAVCSNEPRRFAPSMPRFARVGRFARCGRFETPMLWLPLLELYFWTSFMYKYSWAHMIISHHMWS